MYIIILSSLKTGKKLYSTDTLSSTSCDSPKATQKASQEILQA